ncbi:MAG TPA: prephenate dehydrogenase/arogenate dehydrogenase family protein [Blastocatellia bacterium]|nr:prephenate dehydrogenase/arogenate dehydrogenase family protein [Blastocatellia bacterium]HMV83530.1 prephenate dehydrogenase/arogenate dehydrogenase family protein [Blastocatellia bacterium]HMZ23114.1 prephenate dehydrogenase/arogenate dehydrogenase family protein [Blastocatellia bacterium]HNG30837.1 prephenate dehydrogenase/arogenate dehydrogenase family protein [Blastocatellia bacterium]
MMFDFKHIVIVGCGLLGGSFALALRRAGFRGRITACGGVRSPRLAVERGVADAIEESFERGEECPADLIYLAAPIGAIIDFLKTRSKQISPGAIVTDAGSTKTEICRAARACLSPEVHFIGGHPMAGSENTGVEYARADLFDRATYALTPETATDETQLNRLKKIVEAIGARVILTQPEEHDAAVALISHLPQLTATTLSALLGAEHDGEIAQRDLAQRLAATGWRDMTRLGGSSWSVWRDICLTNQPNLSAALGVLIAELQNLKDALDVRDFNQVKEAFTAANTSVAEHRAIRYVSFESVPRPVGSVTGVTD